MKPLRVAVLGAGHLGRIHTRLMSARDDVELVGIVEPHAETRARVAAEFLCAGYADVQEIVQRIDAALVVTPTQYHHDVALPLLEQGIHCFIEKPITFSVDEADRLIAAARRRQLVLQVGHVERFNPALRAVSEHTWGARYIEAVRTSGYAFRSIDIGVVLDLMIHDIDIILSLAQSEVVDVRAVGTAVLGPHEDMAQARLEFANGCVANLTASRTSFTNQRTLQVFTPRGYACVDLGQRQARVVQVAEQVARGEVDVLTATPEEAQAIKERLFVDYLPQSTIAVPEANAIAEEQSDFLGAIRAHSAPLVTGEAGRNALAVAARILAAIARHQTAPRILPGTEIGTETTPIRKAG
jgi:predicted dehydrogenase